jgi:hypothetical protein
MVTKPSSNPNYSRDGKHHQEESGSKQDDGLEIVSLFFKIEELNRLMNALDQYEFSRKVRKKAIKHATEKLIQIRSLAGALSGLDDTTGCSSPLRYDRHGNCFRWTEANEWLPSGTLCTPWKG